MNLFILKIFFIFSNNNNKNNDFEVSQIHYFLFQIKFAILVYSIV